MHLARSPATGFRSVGQHVAAARRAVLAQLTDNLVPGPAVGAQLSNVAQAQLSPNLLPSWPPGQGQAREKSSKGIKRRKN